MVLSTFECTHFIRICLFTFFCIFETLTKNASILYTMSDLINYISTISDLDARIYWSYLQMYHVKIARGLVWKMGANKSLIYLLEYHGDSESILKAKDKMTQIVKTLNLNDVYSELKNLDICTISPQDTNFPTQLSHLEYLSPILLFVKGRNHDLHIIDKSVGIVGTRANTTYGERVTREIVSGLCEKNCAIVSGGAIGIDSIAHSQCLNSGYGHGNIAFLACKAGNVYPLQNANLFEKMLQNNGSIITEYPPGTIIKPHHFLERNRLIAAFSKCTVVTEAPFRSGALSTASHAKNLGRPVGAVPGSIDTWTLSGNHKLLKGGAALVTSDDDVIDLIESCFDSEKVEAEGEIYYAVLNCLGNRLKSIMKISEESNLDIDTVRSVLATLYLRGIVEKKPFSNEYKLKKPNNNAKGK